MIQLTEKETKKLCGYAERLAKRYAQKLSSRITYDDLVSVGYEAIARATVKHQGKINLRYFWVAIKNAMLSEIKKLSADQSWIVDAKTDDEIVNIVETIPAEQNLEDEVHLRTLALNVRRQIDKLTKAERDYAIAVLIEGCTIKEVIEKKKCSRQSANQIQLSLLAKLKAWNAENRTCTA